MGAGLDVVHAKRGRGSRGLEMETRGSELLAQAVDGLRHRAVGVLHGEVKVRKMKTAMEEIRFRVGLGL